MQSIVHLTLTTSMPPPKKILFVGAFFSRENGTISISEKIALLLRNEYGITLCSHIKSKFLRLFHIVFSVMITPAKIIHVDVFSGINIIIPYIVLNLAKLKKIPVIINLRGGGLIDYYEIKPKLIQYILNNSTYVLSPSRQLKKYFDNKMKNTHVIHFPNFIELETFQYHEKQNIEYKILWIRAFDTVYNPTLAVNILFEVSQYYPQTTLTMVGPDKGLLADTIAIIEKLGLTSKVNITGPVPNNDLVGYYHSHDVFINTTKYESFGVAVFEATCCGIPVVSVPVGEIPYIWNQDEISIASSYNPKDISNPICSLFSNKLLRKSKIRKARSKAETYSWDVTKEKWIELLGKG